MVDFVRTSFRVFRRACRAVPSPRSTYHYRFRRLELAVLRKRIREIARMRIRYGYRRIWILLRREDWFINAKRVYRLYKLEGLTMQHAFFRSSRSPFGSNAVLGSVPARS